jgi:glycine reductase complex component B subunit gamma
MKQRLVHYINQYFGQQGAEESAGMGFLLRQGAVGPGRLIEKLAGDDVVVVATLICGDNYFSENLTTTAEEGLALIAPLKPDLFLAGPAFHAGRYGVACGAMCKIVGDSLKIPSVTGMFRDNPGVEMYRKDVFVCETQGNAAGMQEALQRMLNLAAKLAGQRSNLRLLLPEPLGRPSEDRYFARGVLKNEYVEKNAGERSVEMLLAKLKGLPFRTEIEFKKVQESPPSPPVRKMSSCEVALISDGGLVPKGNPDHFRSRGNRVFAAYETENLLSDDATADRWEIAHTGYSDKEINSNHNRLVPADVMRELEKAGVIGKLHPYFYSTSGNATLSQDCRNMGEQIAELLKDKGVEAAILSST